MGGCRYLPRLHRYNHCSFSGDAHSSLGGFRLNLEKLNRKHTRPSKPLFSFYKISVEPMSHFPAGWRGLMPCRRDPSGCYWPCQMSNGWFTADPDATQVPEKHQPLETPGHETQEGTRKKNLDKPLQVNDWTPSFKWLKTNKPHELPKGRGKKKGKLSGTIPLFCTSPSNQSKIGGRGRNSVS